MVSFCLTCVVTIFSTSKHELDEAGYQKCNFLNSHYVQTLDIIMTYNPFPNYRQILRDWWIVNKNCVRDACSLRARRFFLKLSISYLHKIFVKYLRFYIDSLSLFYWLWRVFFELKHFFTSTLLRCEIHTSLKFSNTLHIWYGKIVWQSIHSISIEYKGNERSLRPFDKVCNWTSRLLNMKKKSGINRTLSGIWN